MLNHYYYLLGNGEIWSTEDVRFVRKDDVPSHVVLNRLYRSGQPAGRAYLRETLILGGFELGELAGPEDRIKEIKARLLELDFKAIRSLRAITSDTGNAEDQEMLATLEAEAKALRQEMAELNCEATA